jgi:hypothetical protein
MDLRRKPNFFSEPNLTPRQVSLLTLQGKPEALPEGVTKLELGSQKLSQLQAQKSQLQARTSNVQAPNSKL